MNKLIINRVISAIITITVLLFSLVGCGGVSDQLQGTRFNEYVSEVQNGSPELIPEITYKEAYNYFFGNPQWRGFTADDGDNVVEFSGDCTYKDEPATAYIQFVINYDDTFYIHYANCTVDGEKVELGESDIISLTYKPFELYSKENLDTELDQSVKDAFAEMYDSIEY